MNEQPRVDNEEAHLLLAELGWLKAKLGTDEIVRVLGHACGPEFLSKCISTFAVPRLLKARGYPFDFRTAPTAALEEALKALWDIAEGIDE